MDLKTLHPVQNYSAITVGFFAPMSYFPPSKVKESKFIPDFELDSFFEICTRLTNSPHTFEITDLANMMDIHSRQLEDFGQFQEKSISDAENKHGASDSKFTLMSTGPAIFTKG